MLPGVKALVSLMKDYKGTDSNPFQKYNLQQAEDTIINEKEMREDKDSRNELKNAFD